jgi:hypothetical protein
MVAVSRTARTIVASMKMATARPTPIILKSIAESVTNTPNTKTITAAALVTTPAIFAIAERTASSVVLEPSTASRTRRTIKTARRLPTLGPPARRRRRSGRRARRVSMRTLGDREACR